MFSSILQFWEKYKQNGRNSNKENDNGCTERYGSTAMVDDHARRMEAKSILGDTGMFEEELASQFRRHSSIDEGNQLEENIGKCLIDIAIQNCKFIPWEKINKTGAKLFSRSKESICLVSHDQKKLLSSKIHLHQKQQKGIPHTTLLRNSLSTTFYSQIQHTNLKASRKIELTKCVLY